MLKPLTTTAALLTLALPVVAQTNWTGDSSSDFADGTNWDNFNPDATTPGVISSGTAEVSGNYEAAFDLTIDGTGTLNIPNGRLLNARPGTNSGASPAVLTVADNGTLNHSGNYFIVGQNGEGTLNQTGGTVNSTIDRGFFLSDGGGDTSAYNLSGGTLNVEMFGSYNSDLHNLWLGRNGQNDSFTISNDAIFNLTNTNPDPSQRRFYLTRDTVFQVDGGTTTVDDFQFFIVGRTRGAGTSQFVLNDGQVNLDLNLALVVGGGEEGRVLVNGGDMTITQGDIWLGDAGSTTLGEMIQTGGDVVVSDGSIVLGSNAGSRGEYTLSGGTLHAQDIMQGIDGEFFFNGGIITLDGDKTGILNEAWFNATAGTFANYDAGSNLTTIAVPEPGSLALLALGGVLVARRRRA